MHHVGASLLVALYFGMAMFFSQHLHTSYIDRDYDYRRRLGERRLGIGFSFRHHFLIEPQYGYLTAKVIGGSGFMTMLSVLMLLPSGDSLTTSEFFSELYFLWILFPAISILVMADIVGRSATKTFLNITAFGMLVLLVLASLDGVTFGNIMSWAAAWAGVSATLGAMGYGAFRYYVSSRHKKYEETDRTRESTHFTPALYFWSTWFVNAVFGFAFVVIVFVLTH